ncbi:MAG: hypothetical protein ACYTG2_08155 [Planctomycetota bacterium]|jgi:hypothetical protein
MTEKKPSRVKGCLMGCGCLVLIVIVGFGGYIGMSVLKGRGAMAAREALDAAHPSADVYVPPFDDAFDPERLQRYLAVRSELLAYCDTFSSVQASFEEMEARGEELDRRGDDASFGEILDMLKGVGGVVGSAMGLAADISEYQTQRDEALLAREMGMGEATWIQAAAGYGLLGREPVFLMSEEDRHHAGPFHSRVNELVLGMIERHLAELQAALDSARQDATGTETSATLAARIAVWQAERDALEADDERLPFADGLPPGMAASLEPFRAEFERTWCEATSGLDLMRTEGHGTTVVVR